MSSYAIVDDQSTRVQYYGPWDHLQLGDNNEVWDGTVSSSLGAGAGAVFEFRGTEVAVGGGVLLEDSDGPPGTSVFSIDDGEPWSFAPPNSYNGTFNNAFFASGPLADGNHKLNFTIVGQGSPYVFDFILYSLTTADEAAASSSSASGPQPTIITTIVAAPTGVPQAQSKSSVPIGPVVGGVVGGVALLVSAIIAFYFLYWTRRRGRGKPYYYHSTSAEEQLESELLKPHIEPYEYPNPPPTGPASVQHPLEPPSRSISTYSYDSNVSVPQAQGSPPALYPPRAGSEYASSASSYSTTSRTSSLTVANPDRPYSVVASLSPAERKAAEAMSRSRTGSQILQHADSGYRFDQGGGESSRAGPSAEVSALEPQHQDPDDDHDVPDELPPIYSES